MLFSDIHAANILVSGERIHLVDWDTPILTLPEEEARFFEGYRRAEVNPIALAYFRYQRAIQDIGEFPLRHRAARTGHPS